MNAYTLDKLIMLLFGLTPMTEIANYRRSGVRNHGQLKQRILSRFESYGKDSRGHHFCLQPVTTTNNNYYYLLLSTTTTYYYLLLLLLILLTTY